MKKKIKLISTFASLGLALALMVFGVYAATSASFKVTTNVSFKATNHVQATISAKDVKNAYATTAGEYNTAITKTIGVDATGANTGDYKTGENAVEDITLTGLTSANPLTAAANKYEYVVEISNLDNEAALEVALTYANKTEGQYTVQFTVTGADEANGKYTLAANAGTPAKLVVTCVVTVVDLAGNAVEFTATDFDLSGTLTAVQPA